MAVQVAREGSVYVVHISCLDDQHRADVFFPLEEMPSVGCVCTNETRQVKGVVGIREHQEVFLGTTHGVRVARVASAWVRVTSSYSLYLYCIYIGGCTGLVSNLILHGERICTGFCRTFVSHFAG